MTPALRLLERNRGARSSVVDAVSRLGPVREVAMNAGLQETSQLVTVLVLFASPLLYDLFQWIGKLLGGS